MADTYPSYPDPSAKLTFDEDAILDENITIPDGECIGHDLEHDRKRYHVTDTGIVIVTNHPSV